MSESICFLISLLWEENSDWKIHVSESHCLCFRVCGRGIFWQALCSPNPRKRRVLLKKAPSHTSSLGSLTSFLNFPKYIHLFLSGGGGLAFCPQKMGEGSFLHPKSSAHLLAITRTSNSHLATADTDYTSVKDLVVPSPPRSLPEANPTSLPQSWSLCFPIPSTQRASHPIHFPITEISCMLKGPLKASSHWKLIFKFLLKYCWFIMLYSFLVYRKEIQPHLCVRVCVQSCVTLCNPMDCNPPCSSDHGISQAELLE